MRRLGRGVWVGLALLVLSGATRPATTAHTAAAAGADRRRARTSARSPTSAARRAWRWRCASSATTSTSARSSIGPASTRGSRAAPPPRELKRAIDAFGFRPGPVWYQVSAHNAGAEMQRQLDAMVRRPRARRPVDRLHALRSQPGRARALSPGARLRPRDERNHLPRAGSGSAAPTSAWRARASWSCGRSSTSATTGRSSASRSSPADIDVDARHARASRRPRTRSTS